MSTVLPNHILKLMPENERKKLGKAGMTAAECREIAVAKCERELQKQLVNLLRLNGVRFVINQRFGVKTTAPKGTPDILFSIKGLACAWEVKMPGEKPSADQVKAMEEMSSDGWRCAIVTTYDQALGLFNQLTTESTEPK